MDQTETASESELQKAINDITKAAGGGGGETVSTDVASAVAAKVAAETAAAAPAAAETTTAETATAEAAKIETATADAVAEAMAAATGGGEAPAANKSEYGDPDLGKVKSQALADLRPLLETVEMIPAKKFLIYKEIIDLNSDKGAIEPAYNTAKEIADDKTRADALVYLVEMIDKLGN